MLDQDAAHNLSETKSAASTYDLVVVGAGISGLNALFAAVDYLPANARVLLIDQKQAAGGMWNTAYDYVRLHQPHPMFTVGDMPWTWDKPATYLAKRDEIRDHLASALEPLSRKVALDTRFGHTVSACDEVATPEGHAARITFHPNDDPSQTRTIAATRAVFASGFNYSPPRPLTLSSASAVSITPQDLRTALRARPGAPVHVVGGGKTGMDTILETWAQDPARAVTLIAGPGTNFMNRTKYVPTGLKRWTSGDAFSRLLRDIALHFDGDNEDATMDHFRRHHSTDTATPNAAFLFGFQSEEEQARIAEGLHQTIPDYLEDVVDTPDGPAMTFRNGPPQPVAADSLFVNCTGSFFRAGDIATPEPCLSPNGAILRITHRDALHFHTSVSGFFTTHLFFRGELRGRGLYAVDHEALFRADKKAWVGATAAQAYLYHLTMVASLPMPVLNRCFLDLDRWYPMPRRLAWFLRMKASAKADSAHCRAVLTRVSQRFDIPCKPLD